MRKITLTLTLFILPIASFANTFEWKGPDGHMHMTDNMPPSAVKYGYTIIDSNGYVVQKVAPALTKEQIAARDAAQEKAEAERAKRNREEIAYSRKRDAFLARYPNKDRINNERQEKLNHLEQRITRLRRDFDELSVSDQESALKEIKNSGTERNEIEDRYDHILDTWNQYNKANQ